jgi:peptidoglycan hydrolase-like protein with peptidoglycan-binding domain
LALVAVVALGAGFGIGQLIKSPAEIAAETAVPPDGLITAKIEARAITSTVVARAEVVFEDPVQVNPVIPEGMTAAVVTGQVPEIGAEVNAGDVILEVSGRPVFVLAGEFPAYRSMGPGSSGRDVLQLRAALSALGFGVGDAEAQAYDAALAEAVRALYQKAGYAPPGSEDQALAQAVRDAKDGVTDATEQRTQAAKDLNRARNDVANAPDEESKAAAEQAVEAATSSYAASERAVTRSVEALADAERAAWTTMPVGEAVFVADLPRRVDQVGVDVGSDLAKMGGEPDPMSGNAGTPTAAVVLSGAEITVTAQVNASEAGLLKVGGPAVLTVDGNEVAGEIAEICPEAAEAVPGEGSAAGAATCAVAITVADLGGADPAAVVGNVLTTMVVGTSSEDSLVVPLAAVSADTAGNARIEIVEGPLAKDQPAAEQKTRTVNIVAGLTAEGMVEIKEADFQLKAGDLVVVGQAGAAAPGGADVDKEAPDAAG